GYEPMAIKYLLLTVSYWRRLNFTFEGLREAAKKIEKICDIIEIMKKADGADDTEKIVKKARKRFERAMDDNLNTGKALKVMEEFTDALHGINPDKKASAEILDTFKMFDSILGLGLFTSF
ncbi:MAG: hypothetical protein O8C67_09110, partial [Candidatus Methanoperedens sp.]|nr:hypothetical protein [Candidatus Methanoperedens sp.]